MFLAVAWTTVFESSRFKLHPEVCSWDVTEDTNDEKRKLLIGINYDYDGKSNRHTHIFLPCGRIWVFNWVAKTAIPILHGSSTCDKFNLFDQDINEYGPF